MKKSRLFLPLLLLFSLFSGNIAQAAVVKPIPVLPEALKNMPLQALLKLSPREISIQTGRELTLRQKISIKLLRSPMKKALRKDPAITAGEFFSSRKKMKGWLLALLIVAGVLLIALLIFSLAYAGKI